MKRYISYIIIVAAFITGCWEEGTTSSNDDAFLEIQNSSLEEVFFRLQDGEFGEYPVLSLLPEHTFTKSWDNYDDLFTENQGEVILEYWNADSLDVTTVQFEIEPYRSHFYDIGQGMPDLIIFNETDALVWFSIDTADNIYLDPEEDYRTYFMDGVPYQIFLEFNGYHVFSDDTEIILNPFNTDEFDIEPTGGAVKIVNSSQQTDITEVYIAMSDDEFWGEEALDGILDTDEFGIWTVSPGTWDVLLVDNWGNEHIFTNNYVQLDNTVTISFRGRSQEESLNTRKSGNRKLGKIEKN